MAVTEVTGTRLHQIKQFHAETTVGLVSSITLYLFLVDAFIQSEIQARIREQGQAVSEPIGVTGLAQGPSVEKP